MKNKNSLVIIEILGFILLLISIRLNLIYPAWWNITTNMDDAVVMGIHGLPYSLLALTITLVASLLITSTQVISKSKIPYYVMYLFLLILGIVLFLLIPKPFDNPFNNPDTYGESITRAFKGIRIALWGIQSFIFSIIGLYVNLKPKLNSFKDNM